MCKSEHKGSTPQEGYFHKKYPQRNKTERLFGVSEHIEGKRIFMRECKSKLEKGTRKGRKSIKKEALIKARRP